MTTDTSLLESVAAPATSHVSSPTVAGPGRRLFHTAIAIVGWAIFAWWWWIVVHRVSLHEVRFTVLFILASIALCIGVTGLWVLHNRWIYRRLGPRTQLRVALLDYSHDPLGRTVTFEVPERSLRSSPIVRIVFQAERKLYRTVRADPPRPPAA